MTSPRTLEGPFRPASAQWPALLVTGPRQIGKTTSLRHLAGRGGPAWPWTIPWPGRWQGP